MIAAVRNALVERFGDTIRFPGIIVDDYMWIPSAAENLFDLVNEYVVNKMLSSSSSSSKGEDHCKGTETNTTLHSPMSRPKVSLSRRGTPPVPPPKNGKKTQIRQGQDITKLPKQRNACPESPLPIANGTVRIVAKVPCPPGDVLIQLPGRGPTISVADLTRQLLAVTPHRMQPLSPMTGTNKKHSTSATEQFYSFRGAEGLLLWKEMFGEHAKVGIDDGIWMQFGRSLIEYGIIHSYTPLGSDFRQLLLVLQPLRDTRSLNRLLQWPQKTETPPADEAMSIILRLSAMMDNIFRLNSSDMLNHPRYLSFQESVCELQNIQVPHEPKSNSVFTLNLHNLIVRNAMIQSTSNDPKWTWPTSLEQFNIFSEKIGYTVAGEFVSVATLRICLFGGKLGTHLPKLAASRSSSYSSKSRFPNIPFCCANVTMGAHFAGSVVDSDVRVLMAMAWGTQSAPHVQTIHPDRLEKELQAAAASFCQTQVAINGSTVELPALLSWFRMDFGKSPAAVLRRIKDFLSEEQKSMVRNRFQSKELVIKFQADCPSEWKCNFAVPHQAGKVSATHALKPNSEPTGFKNEKLATRRIESVESVTDLSMFTSTEVAQNDEKDVAACIESYDIVLHKPDRQGGIDSDKANILGQIQHGMTAEDTVINNLGTRQESRGDSMLFSPSRKMHIPKERLLRTNHSNSIVGTSNTKGCYYDEEEKEHDERQYWHPCLRANVSAMTFGSEFDLMMSKRAVASRLLVEGNDEFVIPQLETCPKVDF